MVRKVVVLDTNVLCAWLKVPTKETANSGENRLDYAKVENFLTQKVGEGWTFILPIAALIETGNFITNEKHYNSMKKLQKFVEDSVQGKAPWGFYNPEEHELSPQKIIELLKKWEREFPVLSIADLTMVQIAQYYDEQGSETFIYTADGRLNAYNTTTHTEPIPKRR